MSKWLKGLNTEQGEAVLHTAGPLLILAGAGSGKTTVLVARTGRLLDEEKIPPARVCVLTFTNKAPRGHAVRFVFASDLDRNISQLRSSVDAQAS